MVEDVAGLGPVFLEGCVYCRIILKVGIFPRVGRFCFCDFRVISSGSYSSIDSFYIVLSIAMVASNSYSNVSTVSSFIFSSTSIAAIVTYVLTSSVLTVGSNIFVFFDTVYTTFY